MQTLRDTYRRSRWLMPAVALALGGVFLVAQGIGGDPTGGLISFAIMAGFAAVLVLLEGRSGAVEIMRRPAVTSAARTIDLAATAFAGVVLITVIFFQARARSPRVLRRGPAGRGRTNRDSSPATRRGRARSAAPPL